VLRSIVYSWNWRESEDESIYVNSQVKEMMGNIRKAFREEVADLMWIDDETRPKIFEKEEAIVEKIGYPEMCVNKTLLAEYYQIVSHVLDKETEYR